MDIRWTRQEKQIHDNIDFLSLEKERIMALLPNKSWESICKRFCVRNQMRYMEYAEGKYVFIKEI